MSSAPHLPRELRARVEEQQLEPLERLAPAVYLLCVIAVLVPIVAL
jgi:hypothetical protein